MIARSYCDETLPNSRRQTVERFGMPVQSSVAGTEGSASCGIAVVLAARDFCQFGLQNQVANDIPKFKWSPNEAWYHRFLCLLDIINHN